MLGAQAARRNAPGSCLDRLSPHADRRGCDRSQVHDAAAWGRRIGPPTCAASTASALTRCCVLSAASIASSSVPYEADASASVRAGAAGARTPLPHLRYTAARQAWPCIASSPHSLAVGDTRQTPHVRFPVVAGWQWSIALRRPPALAHLEPCQGHATYADRWKSYRAKRR
jgi:hypothetical protein